MSDPMAAGEAADRAAAALPSPRNPFARIARVSARRLLGFLLVVQIGAAAALVGTDIARDVLPALAPPIAPRETAPVAPGDQLRPYSPRAVPTRPGQPDSPITLPGDPSGMTFEMTDLDGYGPVMLLSGGIARGDSDRFERALDMASPAPIAVALHSPGGIVVEALRMGTVIRERGLDTVMTADAACVSACPLVLFGGVDRQISRKAWVGLHQASVRETTYLPFRIAISDIQTLQGEVMRHTEGMGVDPSVHIHALSTPPEDVYYLVPDQLEAYRVATVLVD